jgi:hypothetical protein
MKGRSIAGYFLLLANQGKVRIFFITEFYLKKSLKNGAEPLRDKGGRLIVNLFSTRS